MGFAIALSDEQWELVADLFEPPGRRGAPSVIPRRQMVDAMLFIEMARWDACAARPLLEPGATVYGGLDLATTTDLTALVLLREAQDGYLDVIARFWCPAEGIATRSRHDHVPYELWVREGWITPTPGNVTDYDRVREDIKKLAETYRIAEIAFDRWNAWQLVTQLSGDGALMVPIGQGMASMTAPTKEWLARIAAGRVRHGGNPVLRWMAANLVVEQDAAGNLKPSKAKSTERIDGMVAAIMALARLTAPHEPPAREPAIIGLWRSMAAEAEAERTARLAGPGDRVCGLQFRTPIRSIGICGLRAGHGGEHEET